MIVVALYVVVCDVTVERYVTRRRVDLVLVLVLARRQCELPQRARSQRTLANQYTQTLGTSIYYNSAKPETESSKATITIRRSKVNVIDLLSIRIS